MENRVITPGDISILLPVVYEAVVFPVTELYTHMSYSIEYLEMFGEAFNAMNIIVWAIKIYFCLIEIVIFLKYMRKCELMH